MEKKREREKQVQQQLAALNISLFLFSIYSCELILFPHFHFVFWQIDRPDREIWFFRRWRHACPISSRYNAYEFIYWNSILKILKYNQYINLRYILSTNK